MRASTIKAITTAAFAVTAVIPAASAADLAARPYTKAPVMVDPGYNWSGFYIGGNVGYSWGRERTDGKSDRYAECQRLSHRGSDLDLVGYHSCRATL